MLMASFMTSMTSHNKYHGESLTFVTSKPVGF